MGLTGLESLDEFVEHNRRNYRSLLGRAGRRPGRSHARRMNHAERCNYQYIVMEVEEKVTEIARDRSSRRSTPRTSWRAAISIPAATAWSRTARFSRTPAYCCRKPNAGGRVVVLPTGHGHRRRAKSPASAALSAWSPPTGRSCVSSWPPGSGRRAGCRRGCLMRVLVFPGGTEIGLEIWAALRDCKDVELAAAGLEVASHAPYVYPSFHVLPGVYEKGWLADLNCLVEERQIDYIYPAHDDVIFALASHAHESARARRDVPAETCRITRYKSRTYEALRGALPLPRIYCDPPR